MYPALGKPTRTDFVNILCHRPRRPNGESSSNSLRRFSVAVLSTFLSLLSLCAGCGAQSTVSLIERDNRNATDAVPLCRRMTSIEAFGRGNHGYRWPNDSDLLKVT